MVRALSSVYFVYCLLFLVFSFLFFLIATVSFIECFFYFRFVIFCRMLFHLLVNKLYAYRIKYKHKVFSGCKGKGCFEISGFSIKH